MVDPKIYYWVTVNVEVQIFYDLSTNIMCLLAHHRHFFYITTKG